MDKLQQLRDKINAGHSGNKPTNTRREWPFPEIKPSNLAEGSYPMRLLPKHPDKNPIGVVDFPARVIPAGDGRKLYYIFASEQVSEKDEAIHTKYFDELYRLALPFKDSFSKGMQKEFQEFKAKAGVRVPVAIYCNKKVIWPEDPNNKYCKYEITPAENGKGGWFGVTLDLTQKAIYDKLIEFSLSAWNPSQADLVAGVRPTDVFDADSGRNFTLSKSGSGLKTEYKVEMSSTNTAAPEEVKALYAEGKYPDVVAGVRRKQKPKVELIAHFRQSVMADVFTALGIDVTQDPPVMVTPKAAEQPDGVNGPGALDAPFELSLGI